MTGSGLDGETLDALDQADEVHLGIRPDASSPAHETVIWAVVVDGDAFARPKRGEEGRWYREATANPDAALRVDDRRVPAQTIERVSWASYPGPAAAMLREEVLATTLRLLPA